MANSFTLSTTQHYKAISHPLRVRILELLHSQPRTNEELAKALGVASGKLYFHTKTLLDAGLIALVGTRAKGHLTEKLYQAVATHFIAAPPSNKDDQPPLAGLLTTALELYRARWDENPTTDGVLGGHLLLHHTPERRAQFEALLRDLFRVFQTTAVTPETPGAQPLALTLLLHDIATETPT